MLLVGPDQAQWRRHMTNFVFQQVDMFTSHPWRGNPLAVVVGADAPTDAQLG
jgi:predicted PhzF superfamily epimerase YddE/YHI9